MMTCQQVFFWADAIRRVGSFAVPLDSVILGPITGRDYRFVDSFGRCRSIDTPLQYPPVAKMKQYFSWKSS
jgi:hypothetical protein